MKRQKLLPILLAICIMAILPLSSHAVDLWDGSTRNTDWYGDGSAESFTLTTAAEFAGFAELVNSGTNFKGKTVTLTSDINLGGASNPWTPIGTLSNNFQGTFDGGECNITGLYINSTSSADQGLFGYINEGGIVENVNVFGEVTGSNYVGGLVGNIASGSVENCDSAVVVTGQSVVGGLVGNITLGSVAGCTNGSTVTGDSVVGGIVGRVGNNSSNSITNCTNSGAVYGDSDPASEHGSVGGIIGSKSSGSVTNCSNSGIVSGNWNVGGVIGTNNNGSTVNCYNIAAVTGSEYVGGISGFNDSDSVVNSYNRGDITGAGYFGGISGTSIDSDITNCYSTGKVITNEDRIYGGVVATINGGSVTNSYYLDSMGWPAGVFVNVNNDPVTNVGSFESANSAITKGSEATEDSTIPMSSLFDALYAGANAYNLDSDPDVEGNQAPTVAATSWRPSSTQNDNYPIHATYWSDNVSVPTEGDGSIDSPYKITSGAELAWMAQEVNAYRGADAYTLSRDIDLSAHIWTPIGADSQSFRGTFDGENKKITGIYIYAPESDRQGLFGYLDSFGTVKNVSVDGEVTGKSNVGGVVGQSYGSVINCNNSAKITAMAENSNVGGVVGYSRGSSKIENSTNSGTVSSKAGYSNVGGITGYGSGMIISCTNSGTLSSGESSFIGGIVGTQSAESIEESTNSGEILSVGDDSIGGIAGVNQADIINCTNSGAITTTGSSPYIGGVVGHNQASATVVNSSSSTTISASGSASRVGGVVGENEGSVTNSINNSGTITTNSIVGVGGIAGVNSGIISMCDADITIVNTAERNDLGGIVGDNTGSITNCNYNGSVTANGNDSNVGGIVGRNLGVVTNNHNSGSATANGSFVKVGGIAGYSNYEDEVRKGTIANNYNTGNITADGDYAQVGGIAGYSSSFVTNNYSMGTIDAGVASVNVGGVVGYPDNNNTSIITNSYYKSGTGASVGVKYKVGTITNVGSFESANSAITIGSEATVNSTIPMSSLFDALNAGANAYNLDSDPYVEGNQPPTVAAKAWKSSINQNGGYPVYATYWIDNISAPTEGDGSIDSPYKISSGAELAWLAQEVLEGRGSDRYILTNEIDLSEHRWNPIGNSVNKFTGSFDGANFNITGLLIDAPQSDYQALFGYTAVGSTVKNLSVQGSVTANDNAGGVIGYNEGIVINCSNNVIVMGNNRVGGIAGENAGTVTNCTNSASLASDDFLGGIVGYNYGEVTNSYNKESLYAFGTDYKAVFGGVVGYNDGGTVENCYNSGGFSADISPDYNSEYVLGGVVGTNESSGSVVNSYYLTSMGATVGVNQSNGTVTNVGWFESESSEITLNEGVTADDTISKNNLAEALNDGTKAYNDNVTDDTLKAYWWKSDSASSYPIFTDEPKYSDVTGDYTVDREDLRRIADVEVYNKQTTVETEALDLNDDGKVNFLDLAIARNSKNFGK